MEVKDSVSIIIALGALIVAFGSAVFTWHQVRMLRAQLQVDVYSKIAAVNRELIGMGFHHPALFAIFDDKPLEDQQKQKRYLQLWLNHIEIIWKSHAEGLLVGAGWHSSRKDIADFFRLHLVQLYWEDVREFYPAPFVQFIWQIIRENGSHSRSSIEATLDRQPIPAQQSELNHDLSDSLVPPAQYALLQTTGAGTDDLPQHKRAAPST